MRAVPEDVRTILKLGPQEALQVVESANGLNQGDLIVRVNGKKFKSFAEWQELLRTQTDKPVAKLTVLMWDVRGWETGEMRPSGPDPIKRTETTVEVKVQPRPKDDTELYETVYDHVVSNGHRIRTFVTRPKSPGKHPVLFWIQGINASSIDFPLGTKNYVAPAIKAFADDGYVTVRVEKPGVGDSEGGPARLVGWDEEMDIYRQALKALDKYEFVDRSNVFIFGHSMGGCHAPVVCAELPVKGIVTYGTVSNSWLEWAVRAPRIQSILGGSTYAQVDQEVRKVAQFYTYLYTEKRTIAWIKKNHPELKTMCDEQSPDGVMLGDRSIRYMQEVNDRNFCDYWPKLGQARVLALFGEFDWISLREDQTQVADAVNAAHPGYAEFKTVPASDHIFSKCTSMQDSYGRFGKPEAEFNPDIVRIVKEWANRLMSPGSSTD